jgi:hypothetical protein
VKAARAFSLPFRTAFAQKRTMEQQTGPTGIKGLVRWAITPPQSYAVYLIALFLVAGLSFYVGTLKPKKAVGIGPPPMSTPRN